MKIRRVDIAYMVEVSSFLNYYLHLQYQAIHNSYYQDQLKYKLSWTEFTLVPMYLHLKLLMLLVPKMFLLMH